MKAEQRKKSELIVLGMLIGFVLGALCVFIIANIGFEMNKNKEMVCGLSSIKCPEGYHDIVESCIDEGLSFCCYYEPECTYIESIYYKKLLQS